MSLHFCSLSTAPAVFPTPAPTMPPTNVAHPCDGSWSSSHWSSTWNSGSHGCDTSSTYCQRYNDPLGPYYNYYDYGTDSADLAEMHYGYRPEVNTDSAGQYMCLCNDWRAVPTSPTTCAVITAAPTSKTLYLCYVCT
jgi:hypothetical protein